MRPLIAGLVAVCVAACGPRSEPPEPDLRQAARALDAGEDLHPQPPGYTRADAACDSATVRRQMEASVEDVLHMGPESGGADRWRLAEIRDLGPAEAGRRCAAVLVIEGAAGDQRVPAEFVTRFEAGDVTVETVAD